MKIVAMTKTTLLDGADEFLASQIEEIGLNLASLKEIPVAPSSGGAYIAHQKCDACDKPLEIL